MLDFEVTAREVARVVAGVDDDQLTDPTPCEGTPVAGLLDHLAGLTTAFRLAAEKRPLPGGATFSAEDLAPDWRVVLPERLEALAAAWRVPSAWQGTAEAGGVRMPAPAIGIVALNEILLHGWDLAVATAQVYSADPAATSACLAFARDLEAGAPEMRNAMYGPVLFVPSDAPEFSRLLGHAGRNPEWTPFG